jgi:predicted phage baseplate assembly protein
MSAKVTRLTLSDSWLEPTDRLLSAVRGATVYAQSERLELAPEPVTDDVSGNAIELGRLYDRLEAGRWIVVEGERTDIPGSTGVRAAEVAMISGVIQFAAPGLPGEKVHTGILLARPLGFRYRRSTVKVWGNVAKATHGETRAEVLGSGDARQAFQELGLRATPLTYLAAANPLGAEGELEVRVDKVRWHKAGSLVELGPDDRSYVTRTGDDDKTTVLFGDGLTGARLPSGGENVSARYRTGVGPGGNVRAGQISLLQTRPLSVSGVVNPIRASGGAPRDSLDQARRNAPLAVQALDRLVSIQDYEDFARARAGIAKASAQSLSDGRRRVAHLTIAGGGDIPIDPGSDLLRSLRLSLQQWGDPSEPFQVDVRELVLLVIAAGVEIHPDYSWDDVEPRLRAALLDRFGFERRELGQGVALSEVQACMQGVRGVVVADVDALAGVPESVTPAQLALLPGQLQPPPASRVTARPARFVRETRTVEGDETLTDVAAEAGITVADLIRLNPTLVSADPGGLAGTTLVVRLGIRPAQLAILSGAIPDTLILREVKR